MLPFFFVGLRSGRSDLLFFRKKGQSGRSKLLEALCPRALKRAQFRRKCAFFVSGVLKGDKFRSKYPLFGQQRRPEPPEYYLRNPSFSGDPYSTERGAISHRKEGRILPKIPVFCLSGSNKRQISPKNTNFRLRGADKRQNFAKNTLFV